MKTKIYSIFVIALSLFALPACSAEEISDLLAESAAYAEDGLIDTSEIDKAAQSGADIIAELYANEESDVQVEGEGVVYRVLSDDNEGGRHQRFILELEDGRTVMVAHNIDIAPRLDGLAAGDTVAFYGEYYYNQQGGGIHWTHRDPDGSHTDGWLKWDGETFE